MEIPTVDFSAFEGENRSKTMETLHDSCKEWGCFQVQNHGIGSKLMERVKQLVDQHYEEHLKANFYQSEISKKLSNKENPSDVDWESSFFICHRPSSNIHQIPTLPQGFSFIKDSFSGKQGPAVGTKVAKYPQCPEPELVRGLREHTDAGGIILLLQDNQVPGLEFLKDGKWVQIPPSRNNTIFVNIGDQVEVLSNGRYKSALHRVMADKSGSRLSIATFYNPANDAVISPASKLQYPHSYSFGDYLQLYSATKFADKGKRLETMKTFAYDSSNGFHA
ncbi:1-aminocyclopropane-1-carboxylate oxidase 1 [Linum perenne]